MGKPSRGTPADKRLSTNKGGKSTTPKMPKSSKMGKSGY
jgi:hypothetical protein